VANNKTGLFPALLKHWRGRRSLSQLDLSIRADVSARHVSFLETGKAQPSEGMILRLASALDVPLRAQNELLRAAGFGALFDEPALHEGLPGPVSAAIDRMLAHHEPFPMVVMNRHYDTLRQNGAADRLLALFIADPTRLTLPVNALRVFFDPAGARPFVQNWEDAARAILARAHREALHHPEDERMHSLMTELLAFPDVPASLCHPDLSRPSMPVFNVQLRRGDMEFGFLTTITTFTAPQNVTLEELRIESYFPLDDGTEEACRALAG
jgi:transcriptional regulator with XRE-family HTH domain